MGDNPPKKRQIWKSVQLYIRFFKDRSGNLRNTPLDWTPKQSSATIDRDNENLEVIVGVAAAHPKHDRNLQIKFSSDQIGLVRDPGAGWEAAIFDEDRLAVKVNGIWIVIQHDGTVVRTVGDDVTIIEEQGSVTKKSEFVQSRMSSDGLELSRRTPDNLSVISLDGMLSKAMPQNIAPLKVD